MVIATVIYTFIFYQKLLREEGDIKIVANRLQKDEENCYKILCLH